jgi:hypothetical protein
MLGTEIQVCHISVYQKQCYLIELLLLNRSFIKFIGHCSFYNIGNYCLFFFFFFFLARRVDCPESYCHDPGVGVTPQGKDFNLGYIF